MSTKKIKIIFSLSILFLLESCGSRMYTFRVFTFPNEIQPHKKGWEYRAVVSITSNCGVYNLCDKKVHINIYDANEKEVLVKNYYFKSVYGITSISTWKKAGNLKIDLIEDNGEIHKPLKTLFYSIIKNNWNESKK